MKAIDTGLTSQAVARFASFLRRGLVNAGDIEELFDRLEKLFDLRGVMIVDGFESASFLTHGVPEKWMRDHERLAHEDPSRKVLIGAPAGTWWSAQREMTAVDWRSEVASCFVETGFREVALVRLYNPFRDDLILGVYRSDRKFTKRAMNTLELLYPHLAGALATRRALNLIKGKDETGVPTLFVAFPGGKVELDPSARRLLARYLGPITAIGWSRVERAIAKAASKFAFAQSGGRSQMMWPGLRVDFAAIPPRPTESLRLAGFLVEEGPDHFSAVDPPALVESVLSPRQLAVASQFAAGLDIPTIAELLRIGDETARSHLRGAYAKLRVRNRAELAAILAQPAARQ